MGKSITGAEYPLSKIFSMDFDYYIPPYQRPYAWTDEETGTLFDDLYDFYKTEVDDNYFLGSIVLIKSDDKAHADVIDGQQRLTTLTILLAVLASYFDGDMRNEFSGYLREPGKALQGLKPQPRLHLREKDQPFFEKYIQNIDIDTLLNLDPVSLDDEAKQNIENNCRVLKKRIDEAFNCDLDEMKKFSMFLVQRCYIVSVSTPSQPSAFRIFSVMNSRGLDLLPIDIIKAQVIGKINENDRENYTEKWENLETQATRIGFNELFGHIRMIFIKVKPQRPLLDDFNDYIISKVDPQKLIDDIIEPYSDAYKILKNKEYTATSNADKTNEILMWLNKIDNSDWMPTAIKFFSEHKNEPDYILWFVTKLERLASFMHITAKDVNERIERYGRILNEIEKRDTSISDPIKTIELSEEEQRDFIMQLSGDVYKMRSRRRNYLILRLDSFVSDAGAKYDPHILTIEHVLPQTVAVGSEWEKLWPDVTERERWLNKIANLVPLTRQHNSKAQNYDFDVKKKTYFSGKNGITSYRLTTQVNQQTTWSPEVVEERQKDLIKIFCEKWNLKE